MLTRNKKIKQFKKQHPNCYIALTKKERMRKRSNVNVMLKKVIQTLMS